MKISLFAQFTKVKQLLSDLAGDIVEYINGEREAGKYISDDVLVDEYSIDGNWESASTNDSHVIAEIVAQDSPLPVKDRGSMKSVSGKIVKIGMKKTLKETMITNIKTLIKLGRFVDAVAKLFNDKKACVVGIKEMQEKLFLEGISTGYATISNKDSEEIEDGELVRVSYGFRSENQMGVKVKWGETGYKPISDMVRFMATIAGSPRIIWCHEVAFNYLRNSAEAAELYIRSKTGFIPENATLVAPTVAAFKDVMYEEYGVTFRIIKRTMYRQEGKLKIPFEPFSKDVLVFLTQEENLGRKVYSDLAESEEFEVDGVEYETYETYIQVSSYSTTEPLLETTRAQARMLPVIDGVEDIFLLHINEVDEDLVPEEDEPTVELEEIASDATSADFTVTADNFEATKNALIGAGVTVTANTTSPATLQGKVGALSSSEWSDFVGIYNNIVANS